MEQSWGQDWAFPPWATQWNSPRTTAMAFKFLPTPSPLFHEPPVLSPYGWAVTATLPAPPNPGEWGIVWLASENPQTQVGSGEL